MDFLQNVFSVVLGLGDFIVLFLSGSGSFGLLGFVYILGLCLSLFYFGIRLIRSICSF